MKKRAVIIGSGIAGIGAAIRIANLGFEVEVFEKNAYLGGKLSEFVLNGYRFDAGPSLFTLPEQVEELFLLSGKKIEDYFSYIKLSKITNYFFENGKTLKAYSNPEKFAQEAENQLKEPKENTLKYLQKSKLVYEMTENVFLKKSLHQLSTYLSFDTLKAILKIHHLDNFRSLHQANQKSFRTSEMRQLFDRYATYNGSNPYLAPATLKVIPHLEFGLGAYFPKKGMFDITQSLVNLAKDLGVKFHLEADVQKILLKDKKVVGIRVGEKDIEADVVVSNMDIVGTYRKLLPSMNPAERILRQTKSSSAIIFYWGIKHSFPELDLHNVFFSKDYKEEFSALFDKNTLAEDLTVYVNISSKYLSSDAPKGCENWFVMVNAPCNTGQDWDSLIALARKKVITKLSRMLKINIEPLIEVESILEPRLIEAKTSSFQGALYGNSSNNPYAAFLRHPNFSAKIKNLYFCGGSVHPGGGIPLSLLSAKIVGDLVRNKTL
ncbi:MAG: phytoene desaturase family protein [Flammeovirgaceae bacterium]